MNTIQKHFDPNEYFSKADPKLQEQLRAVILETGVKPEAIEPLIVAAAQLLEYSTPETRSTIVHQSKDKSSIEVHSTKMIYLAINKAQAAEFLGASFVNVAGIAANPNLSVIGAALLALICGIRRISTLTLSERDSSIFWQMIQSSNHYVADEAEVINRVNADRVARGLAALRSTDFKASLDLLARYRFISQREPGKWKITERFTVQ